MKQNIKFSFKIKIWTVFSIKNRTSNSLFGILSVDKTRLTKESVTTANLSISQQNMNISIPYDPTTNK